MPVEVLEEEVEQEALLQLFEVVVVVEQGELLQLFEEPVQSV